MEEWCLYPALHYILNMTDNSLSQLVSGESSTAVAAISCNFGGGAKCRGNDGVRIPLLSGTDIILMVNYIISMWLKHSFNTTGKNSIQNSRGAMLNSIIILSLGWPYNYIYTLESVRHCFMTNDINSWHW